MPFSFRGHADHSQIQEQEGARSRTAPSRCPLLAKAIAGMLVSPEPGKGGFWSPSSREKGLPMIQPLTGPFSCRTYARKSIMLEYEIFLLRGGTSLMTSSSKGVEKVVPPTWHIMFSMPTWLEHDQNLYHVGCCLWICRPPSTLSCEAFCLSRKCMMTLFVSPCACSARHYAGGLG